MACSTLDVLQAMPHPFGSKAELSWSLRPPMVVTCLQQAVLPAGSSFPSQIPQCMHSYPLQAVCRLCPDQAGTCSGCDKGHLPRRGLAFAQCTASKHQSSAPRPS